MTWAGWQFAFLPGLSAGVALLEADSVLVGQWMLSRPILIGPLVGAACGRLWTGVVLGALNELFSLDNKPMGACVPLNAPLATGCAVLLSAGPYPVPMAAAFPVGLGLGLGHRWMENAIRTWRAAFTREAERGLLAGRGVPWISILSRGIGVHVVATAAFIYVTIAAMGPALTWAWSAAPQFLRAAAETALLVAPWLGLAALIRALSRGT